MAGKALWRRGFDAVERPVGNALEQLVQTERFADAAGLLVRLRAAVERRIEQESRRALHRANLPAASDITRLREQVAQLDRTVRRLRDSVEAAGLEQGGATGGSAARTGRGAGTRTTGRGAQPAPRAQRREVRGGGGPAAGGPDAEAGGVEA